MAKTTQDRRRRRRDDQPKEFGEHVLEVRRVTRVVRGGRRLRFRATVILGDNKGRVGMGTGKSSEVQAAVQKATAQAKRNMFRVPLTDIGSIPHTVDCKFKAAQIRLIPASEGTGIIAGGALRPILELTGVKNVLSKRYGTTNAFVNAQATIEALKMLRPVRKSQKKETKKAKEVEEEVVAA